MPSAVKVPSTKLKLPQRRILSVLSEGIGELPVILWPGLTRQRICERAGFSPTSGTFTNAMNGVREGSSTGKAHPGLLRLGLVRIYELDVDGAPETVYQLTEKGKIALQSIDKDLPDLRDRVLSTNTRYKEPDSVPIDEDIQV